MHFFQKLTQSKKMTTFPWNWRKIMQYFREIESNSFFPWNLYNSFLSTWWIERWWHEDITLTYTVILASVISRKVRFLLTFLPGSIYPNMTTTKNRLFAGLPTIFLWKRTFFRFRKVKSHEFISQSFICLLISNFKKVGNTVFTKKKSFFSIHKR